MSYVKVRTGTQLQRFAGRGKENPPAHEYFQLCGSAVLCCINHSQLNTSQENNKVASGHRREQHPRTVLDTIIYPILRSKIISENI